MLRVDALTKSFDGFQAVNGAYLQVGKGTVVAVIGPNGAGKTTLFNLITGQLVPDAGSVTFKNSDITGLPPHRICRKGIGRSFQIVNIFHRLTVFENVQIAVLSQQKRTFNLLRPARKLALEQTGQILQSVGLQKKAGRISGELSHGDQKVLEIAISLGNEPELLILDEPTAGMSPEETEATLTLMRRLSGELGLTILFCEHDMGMVFSVSDEIMVMHQGKSLIQDKPHVIRQNDDVQRAYLGDSQPC